MRIPPLLKRPTNPIPLSYERFLSDRFNARIPDGYGKLFTQKLPVKSIFGDLSTHPCLKKEPSNQLPFNSSTFNDNKDRTFDFDSFNRKDSGENTKYGLLEEGKLTHIPTSTPCSTQKPLSDNSTDDNHTHMIDDFSKPNDLYEGIHLIKPNSKESELSPSNYITKIGENESSPNPTDSKDPLDESCSGRDGSDTLVRDPGGSNISEGRYSHLNVYRNETVQTIVAKGVDVPERLNCLIKERGLRGLTKECLEILSEMKKLKIPISTETYNNCLIGCMKTNNAKLSRYLFLCLRSDILIPDLRTYTLMIKTHINSGDISSGFALYKKMENEGIKADLVVFSVLIDSLVENNQINSAWQLFRYMRTWRLIEPDEVLFTIMIKSCVQSREAEKALNLYEEMITMNRYPTLQTYTELINCLSNRKEYFHQCFKFYNQIKSQEYPITDKIITYLLRSCCSVGNVRKAREVLLEASNMKINLTLEMYNIYIKTFARQMKLFKLSDNEKINHINKTWSIVQTVLSKYDFTGNQSEDDNTNSCSHKDITRLLNSVILVYENGNYFDYALEVLNCFQKFNAKPDYMTYFILLRMLGPKMRDPGRFFTLWKEAKTLIDPGRTLLCMALDMAILSRSAKRTLEILNDMYNAKVFPTPSLMKKLYESGKRITQIHLMINNLVTLQRKLTYQEKVNENKLLKTYIEEHELRNSLTPAERL